MKPEPLHKLMRERLKVRYRLAKEFLLQHVVGAVVFFILVSWLMAAWCVLEFEKDLQGSNITTYADAIWWGIVTVLTVGYGDKYPISQHGREIAALLMVVGVMSVGIITAKISTVFLERTLRQGRGFVDTNQLKDHFVICGWVEDMAELLTHILDFNTKLKAKDMVIVANADSVAIEGVRSEAHLKDVQIVVGDHFSETYLKRAAPDRAHKILILADRTKGSNGLAPTHTEVDARTIMTAMTLANIARGTEVTAEILDPKMDHYLKLAGVSEIIYTSEYSRLVIGNTSNGRGLANILFDLLDPKTHSCITTVALDQGQFRTSYSNVKKGIESKHPEYLVIGILENSGNSHQIKEMALRQAQQTPDVAQLVRNLHLVKELRCNHPVIHPDDGYAVKEGSMAIVIENFEKKRGANVADAA